MTPVLPVQTYGWDLALTPVLAEDTAMHEGLAKHRVACLIEDHPEWTLVPDSIRWEIVERDISFGPARADNPDSWAHLVVWCDLIGSSPVL
jgi:hypothetical protein